MSAALPWITQLFLKSTEGIWPLGLWQVTQLLVSTVFTWLNKGPGMAEAHAAGLPPGGGLVAGGESLLLQATCNNIKQQITIGYRVDLIFRAFWVNGKTFHLVG
jgi:hypothetical protein